MLGRIPAGFVPRSLLGIGIVTLLVLGALIAAPAHAGSAVPRESPPPATGAPGEPVVALSPSVPSPPASVPTERAIGTPQTPPPPAAPYIGSLFATVSVANAPLGGVYDPVNGYIYVANSGSNSVTIINGTSIVTTVGVPSRPEGGAFDPTTDQVDIVCEGANVVAFLDGITVNGSVAVGSEPYAAVFDPQDQEVYVANYFSDNLTLLQGTRVLGSVALPANSGPVAVAYDASDSEVYVSEYAANSVSVLFGGTIVATVPVGTGPGGLAYDAANQQIDVVNSNSTNFTTIQGSQVVHDTFLGYPAWGVAYDAANQLLYLTDYLTDNATAVSGTTVVGTVPTDGYPYGVLYDETNGCMDVINRNSDTVNVFSTSLRVGALAASPTGNPANSTDVNETISLNATVTGNQSWAYQTAISVSPAGLGCGAAPALSLASGYVVDSCTPTAPGTYLATVTVNATGRIAITTSLSVKVYGQFSLGRPVASVGSLTGVAGADVGLSVTWNLTPTGGTLQYSSVSWIGFPAGDCFGTSSPQPTCTFKRTGSINVFASATDTNGETAYSPGLAFPIDGLPVATTPSANRTSADVGQPVGFTTHASGGSGTYTYNWIGVPPSCASTSIPTLDCAATQPGIFSVSVRVVDSFGGTSPTTSAIGLVIYTDPVVLAPVPSPASVSTHELFTISLNVTGGLSVNESSQWEGVPSGCSFAPYPLNTTATCRTSYPGTYLVFVRVRDGNGFVVTSPRAEITVTGSPPNNQTNQSSGSTIFGLPATEFYAAVGALVVLVAVAAAALALRRGRSRPPESYEEEGGEDAGPDEGTPLSEGDLPEEGTLPEGGDSAEGYPADEDPAPDTEPSTETPEPSDEP